jgi:hypothetical protein
MEMKNELENEGNSVCFVSETRGGPTGWKLVAVEVGQVGFAFRKHS